MTTPFAYREYYTTPPLSQFIRKIWVLDNTTNPHPISDKNVLPNSCFNLAFVHGNGLTIHNQRGHLDMPQDRYFCGQARYRVEVIIKPFTHVTMVQLHPWTPSSWTADSLAHTVDNIVPLRNILPLVDNLFSGYDPVSIQAAYSETSLIAFTQAHFAQLPNLANSTFPLRQACLRLQQTNGCLRIADLADELQCSTRQLEKQFKRYLGLTPKELTRILRIRGVIDTLQTQKSAHSLAQVATEFGFYDQAHFIRVFRNMIRHAPGEFRAVDYLLPLSGTGY
ncbi:AraC family transcriptional regulator [Spirosoma endbachense]|uniref:Helix-turn-helix domain-containing protein n=1 Tax=Spirosoma endbachense TaxID=2666025 RepID=A0A6P1VTL1_9BACT|nr:helix-turn-helix domain-containing protein [Spirosoma endbachense]QHV95330.1 helix-turn-helix domain-containing protein [Spirosoma endbachense]